MIDRLFLRHPRNIGESYPHHAATAFGVGAKMIAGGVAAMIHGLVPAFFETTGSRTIKSLYARLDNREADANETFRQSDFQI